MKKIYLLSHCQASGQHKDSPLTTEGTRQAELLSLFLNEHDYEVDKIISSSYFRAVESIRPYAQSKNLKIEQDNRLHEFILSSEPLEDWIEAFKQAFMDPSKKLPGGESADQAVKRAKNVLEDLYKDEKNANVVLVTHRNLLSLILKKYTNFSFDDWKELKHPDIHVITYNKGVESVERLKIAD